jgi:hypothetical protein
VWCELRTTLLLLFSDEDEASSIGTGRPACAVVAVDLTWPLRAIWLAVPSLFRWYILALPVLGKERRKLVVTLHDKDMVIRLYRRAPRALHPPPAGLGSLAAQHSAEPYYPSPRPVGEEHRHE